MNAVVTMVNQQLCIHFVGRAFDLGWRAAVSHRDTYMHANPPQHSANLLFCANMTKWTLAN
jgi:hypothetical protein